jgi:hypothetical protein
MGEPKEMPKDTSAFAEAANPVTAISAIKPRNGFNFIPRFDDVLEQLFTEEVSPEKFLFE